MTETNTYRPNHYQVKVTVPTRQKMTTKSETLGGLQLHPADSTALDDVAWLAAVPVPPLAAGCVAKIVVGASVPSEVKVEVGDPGAEKGAVSVTGPGLIIDWHPLRALWNSIFCSKLRQL